MSGEEIAKVLAEHRINYHSRNIGGQTAESLRYTSCEGCDWKGGWHDEAGWEAHLAAVLLPLVEQAKREKVAEALRDAADDVYRATGQSSGVPVWRYDIADWLRDRAERAAQTPQDEGRGGEG